MGLGSPGSAAVIGFRPPTGIRHRAAARLPGLLRAVSRSARRRRQVVPGPILVVVAVNGGPAEVVEIFGGQVHGQLVVVNAFADDALEEAQGGLVRVFLLVGMSPAGEDGIHGAVAIPSMDAVGNRRHSGRVDVGGHGGHRPLRNDCVLDCKLLVK